MWQRELVRIARIDASDERVNGVIQKLLPEPADDEFGDALLLGIAARRDEGFAQDSQLGF